MSDAIGALSARVRLERPTRTADDLGGAAISWTDEGEVWAHVEVPSAASAERFDTDVSTASLRLTIRKRTIRAGWRVIWGARVLRVVGVRDDGAERITLSCEEETL